MLLHIPTYVWRKRNSQCHPHTLCIESATMLSDSVSVPFPFVSFKLGHFLFSVALLTINYYLLHLQLLIDIETYMYSFAVRVCFGNVYS